MKSDDSLNQLQHEINRRVKIAAHSLLNNDTVAASENIEWLKLATPLIDKYEKKPGNIQLSLIIVLISVLLIGLGLTIRVPKAKISVNVMTQNAGFTLKKRWVLNNRFSSSELNISNLKEVSWAGANMNVKSEQPFTFELKGRDIVLDQFALDSNSELTIQLQDGMQHFSIKNDSIVTDIQVGKASININDGQLDTTLDSEIPQIFKVKSFKSRGMPVDIMLSDTGRWSIRDILISDINFLQESFPGSGKFLSSIASGSVKILETDKEVKLEEGDWLLFEDLNISRFQISKAGSELKIHMEGEVSNASTGSELFVKNLNPTIIEYLYYAKSFAFFWSSMIFMWSLLWSFKNTILPK